MDAVSFFFLHVLVYSAFPLCFLALDSQTRALYFYLYLTVTLLIGGLFGAIYSFELAPGVEISSGAMAYGAFMMGTILLIANESNLAVVKSIIRLVVLVNLFALSIHFLLSNAFEIAQVSVLGLEPYVLFTAKWVIMLGGLVIIAELLLLFSVLEYVKPKVLSTRAMVAMYTTAYIAILCVDGIIYPLLLVGLNSESPAAITGNLTTKLAVASAFAVPTVLYLIIFPEIIKGYMNSPLHLRGLLPFAGTSLRKKVRRQERFLALSENQLRELAKRHALSAESAGLGFWSIDTTKGLKRAIEADERCYEIHNISPTELEGDTFRWLELVVEEDREKLIAIYNSSEQLDWPLTLRYRIQCDREKQRHVEVFARRDESPQGTVRILGVLRDVTDAVELQKRHEQLQEQMHRQQKMESVGQFAGGIAHDFNNLLTPIIGLADLNRAADADRAALRRDIEEIWKAGLSAKELTNKLLAFGSQQVLTPIAVDLNRVVFELDAILARLVSENIERVYEVCDDNVIIDADRGQIEQVLLNLVSNACDSMPDGGTLTIRTERVSANDALLPTSSEAIQSTEQSMGAVVRLSVVDNGAGMEPEVLEQMFEPFYTTKDRNKGTGLGLATSFGIVQQHKGSIRAYSAIDEGTVLQIDFPASTSVLPKEVLDHHARPELANENVSSKQILVVEDDAAVLRTVERLLSASGYSVVTESNPKQALARDNSDIDLVITDLIMPAMSGIELIEQLRARRPDLKTLIISGYQDDIKLTPHENFLQKPFSSIQLITKVSATLKSAAVMTATSKR